jgi:hypothetical protein
LEGENIMTTALVAQIDCNSADKTTSETACAPEMTSTSSSLIVVMVVYVLFGAAGFFAAAQLL